MKMRLTRRFALPIFGFAPLFIYFLRCSCISTAVNVFAPRITDSPLYIGLC